MVFAVFSIGPDAAIEAVRTQVIRISNGWQQISRGVWLMGNAATEDILRDHLGRYGAQVVVIRLQGNWASQGFPQLAEWLQAAQNYF